ncbi:MAG: hypothetical protein L3J06_05695 [Cyclobacteriaceae bacterium]|nr:hypothetical protein [Cyclobacteriaceae bacterium]
MMAKFEDFKKRMDRKLNVMDAKMSYMNEGLKGVSKAFKEFKVEFDDFIDFTADSYNNHEKIILELERRQ